MSFTKGEVRHFIAFDEETGWLGEVEAHFRQAVSFQGSRGRPRHLTEWWVPALNANLLRGDRLFDTEVEAVQEAKALVGGPTWEQRAQRYREHQEEVG